MKKGYTLFYSKKDCILKITKIKENNKWWKDIEVHCNENSVHRWNDCYYLSQNRVALKNCAYALKDQWIKESQHRLKKTLEIKL